MSSSIEDSNQLSIPKKPKTGFFEYVAKHRDEEPGENKEKIASLSNKWNSLSDLEKEKYNSIYKKNMIIYSEKMESLKSTPEGRALLEEKEKARKNKRNKKKNNNKKVTAPRKITPYNLFVKANFNSAKVSIEADTNKDGKASVGEVVKIVASKWNALSENAKNEWIQKAETINKEKENTQQPE